MRKRICEQLAFFAVIGVFFLFDIGWLRRPYYIGGGDGLEAYLALGLNWIAGEPFRGHHQPGIFFQELAAISMRFLGLPEPNQGLWKYHYLAVGVHVVTALLCSLWIADLVKARGGTPIKSLLLGLVWISMPAVVSFSGVLAPNFLVSLLLLPATLEILSLGLVRPRPKAVFLALASLGFCLANYFLVLPLVVVVLLWMFLQSKRDLFGGQRFYAPLVMLHYVCVVSVLYSLERSEFYPSLKGHLLVHVPVLVLISLAPARAWALWKNCVFPMLVGWLLGVNRLLSAWVVTGENAFLNKGSAPRYSWFEGFDPVGMISSYLWVALLLLSVAFLWRTSRRVFLFALLLTTLTVVLTGDLGLVRAKEILDFGDRANWAHPLRYWLVLALVPAIAALESKRKSASAILVVLALGSLVQFGWVVRPAVTQAWQAERQASEWVSKGRLVICGRTTIPSNCGATYVYENYLTEGARQWLQGRPMKSQSYVYMSSLCLESDLKSAVEAHYDCSALKIVGQGGLLSLEETRRTTYLRSRFSGATILTAAPGLVHLLIQPTTLNQSAK